jgi:hypothetical protein
MLHRNTLMLHADELFRHAMLLCQGFDYCNTVLIIWLMSCHVQTQGFLAAALDTHKRFIDQCYPARHVQVRERLQEQEV